MFPCVPTDQRYPYVSSTTPTILSQDTVFLLWQVACEYVNQLICLLQIAIEPKSKADNDKMGAALYKLAQEDPSFHFSRDDETNQTVIEGMGELHLDIIVDRMKREFNVAADIGAPQV